MYADLNKFLFNLDFDLDMDNWLSEPLLAWLTPWLVRYSTLYSQVSRFKGKRVNTIIRKGDQRENQNIYYYDP